jgi:CheY-like chemotaxis protein
MKRVLVVDDDRGFRSALAKSLKVVGYEILEAQNGVEALQVVEQQPVDVVITDIYMPEKEGLETIKALRRVRPEVNVIAVSGGYIIPAQDCLFMAKALGAQRALAKPFTITDIVCALTELGMPPSPAPVS